MTPTPPPAFSWRREAPWLLIPIACALFARLMMAPYAIATLNGDACIHLLIGRHGWHWLTGATGLHAHDGLPLMFYGQSYVGSFEGMLSAPFYAWLGPTPVAMGVAQALLAAVLAVQLYRLAYELVPQHARLAALAASVPFALGNTLLLLNAAGQYGSYPSTQLFGVGCWLVALPLLRGRSTHPVRLGALGLLAGLGVWNNPQVSSYLAPIVGLALLRGHLLAAWREGRLAVALGILRWPATITLTLNALAVLVTIGLCVWLTFAQSTFTRDDGTTVTGVARRVDDGLVHVDVPGPDGPQRVTIDPADIDEARTQRAGELRLGSLRIGLTRPHRYVVRVTAALLGQLILLELLLSLLAASKRWRAIGLASALSAGFVVGLVPLFAFKASDYGKLRALKNPPVGLDPAMAPTHLRSLPAHAAFALADPPPHLAAIPEPLADVVGARPGPPRYWPPGAPAWTLPTYALTRWLLIAFFPLAAAGALYIARHTWTALLTLRPEPTGATVAALAAIQATVVLTLYLGFPGEAIEPRYLRQLWVPAALLTGAAVAHAARRHQRAGIALLLSLLACAAIGTAGDIAQLRQQAHTRPDRATEYLDHARADGVTAGYANFWVGYEPSYLSDEAIVFAPLPNQVLRHYRPFDQRARRARRVMWIVEPSSRLDRDVYERLLRAQGIRGAGAEAPNVGRQRLRRRRLVGNPSGSGWGPYIIFTTEARGR